MGSILSFVLDADEYRAEIPALFQKTVNAVGPVVWPFGVVVGVIAHEATIFVLYRNKMSAQLPLFSPVIKDNAHIAVFCGFIVFLPVLFPDFPLLLHIRELLEENDAVNIPWTAFESEFEG